MHDTNEAQVADNKQEGGHNSRVQHNNSPASLLAYRLYPRQQGVQGHCYFFTWSSRPAAQGSALEIVSPGHTGALVQRPA